MQEILDTLITACLNRQAPAGMQALAEQARKVHGANVLAVIGYGSCLRDGVSPDKIIDIYVLLERYGAMPDGIWLQAGNRLLPPNVYYLETPFEGHVLRAKYATVTLDAFEDRVSADTRNPYFWARFAQPCALLYARDIAVSNRLVKAIAAAVTSLLSTTLPLMPDRFTPQELWTTALEQTYQTEWRSEGRDRAAQIITADQQHYERITPPALARLAPDGTYEDTGGSFTRKKIRLVSSASCARQWRSRRLAGKAYATLRLIKAAFTFQGGIDYLLWKVARHSGVEVTPTAFQRKHPLLGAPALAWKVYRRGGFR